MAKNVSGETPVSRVNTGGITKGREEQEGQREVSLRQQSSPSFRKEAAEQQVGLHRRPPQGSLALIRMREAY